MSFVSRAARVAAVLLFALTGPAALLSTLMSTPASAASPPPSPTLASQAPAAVDGYTYWGYYVWNTQKSQWDYMTVGANDPKQLPEDGDVYGFRWALVVQDPRVPRAEAGFDELCADTPEPQGGQKRVGLVIDYGADVDAPEGESVPQPSGLCAVVDEGATVQQALQTQLDVRTGDDGLVCGIDGYPAQGCGDVIKDAAEGPADTTVPLADGSDPSSDSGGTGSEDTDSASSASDGDDSPPWGLLVAGGVVVALVAAALVLRTRRA